MKNSELGTWIDGIASTSDLDSSGERIDVDGINIDVLAISGTINSEHKADTASQTIGKIIEAKKILKESDCKNDRHKYFWEKARKRPYLYIAAVLFDGVGHTAATDAAAMFKFDQLIDTKETKGTGWFSIEGSRLGKEGSNITKCIAKKVSWTLLPCNRACIAELLEDPDKYCKQITKQKIESSMKKAEQEEETLKKAEPKKYFKELGMPKTPKGASYSKITPATGEHKQGSPIEPKRTFTSQNAPDKMKVGDRIEHKKPSAKAGNAFYRDIYKDSKGVKKEESCKTIGNKIMKKKSSKKEIMKHLGNEAWNNFKDKELLIEIIQKRGEFTKSEVIGIAKTIAYMDMKKKESELQDLFEKDEDIQKAKIDEGKSPSQKQVARAMRNKRTKTINPETKEYKITGTPKTDEK